MCSSWCHVDDIDGIRDTLPSLPQIISDEARIGKVHHFLNIFSLLNVVPQPPAKQKGVVINFCESMEDYVTYWNCRSTHQANWQSVLVKMYAKKAWQVFVPTAPSTSQLFRYIRTFCCGKCTKVLQEASSTTGYHKGPQTTSIRGQRKPSWSIYTVTEKLFFFYKWQSPPVIQYWGTDHLTSPCPPLSPLSCLTLNPSQRCRGSRRVPAKPAYWEVANSPGGERRTIIRLKDETRWMMVMQQENMWIVTYQCSSCIWTRLTKVFFF